MSAIPDFSKIAFAPVAPQQERTPRAWLTPEGIEVKSDYGPQDIEGLSFIDGFPGVAPYVRGPYPTM